MSESVKRTCTFHDTRTNKEISEDGLCHDATVHHALKYHDPTSEYYIGEECVKCAFSLLERRLKDHFNAEIRGCAR